MAIIRKKELNQMNKESLKSKLLDLKRELIKINTQISTRTLPENPGRVKELKRTIARINTNLNKKSKTEVKTKPQEGIKKT